MSRGARLRFTGKVGIKYNLERNSGIERKDIRKRKTPRYEEGKHVDMKE